MKKILIFYAGLLYDQCVSFKDYRLLHLQMEPEIYNGAFVYVQESGTTAVQSHSWYRPDGTPMLLDDVPKTLRTLALLLT